MVGRTLSHYDILEKLGEGGMGLVYKARDKHLGRFVALKVLPPEKVGDPERKRRFEHEARAASSLDHPNIITIYDIDTVEGVDFIAMEYVEGRTLRQLVGPHGLELHIALEYAAAMADAMAAAHRAGIVHRDLKPENVMISGQGHLKILDFGLAKLTEPAPAGDSETVTVNTADATLTKQGAILGTVAYMSPEQVEGKKVDARSDVFSFGAVLYEMLAGRRPFHGHSTISTMSAILRDSPAPVREIRADIPTALERILRRCLEKARESRYPSAVELHRDLRLCQDRLAARVRRPRFAAPALALLVAVIAIAAWSWMRSANVRWAVSVALPEIARLADRREYAAATSLAMQAEKYIPTDRRLAELTSLVSIPVSMRTNVPGVEIRFKEYADVEGAWQLLGQAPLENIRVPRGLKRWRIEKPGFQTIERAVTPDVDGASLTFRLDKGGSVPSDMVRVPGGSSVRLFLTGLDHLPLPPLDDFLIDKYEISNKQFAAFVAAGGYRKPEYWKQLLVKDGRVLPWQEAMAGFRDSTGRPGPATWELGEFPAGQGDYPVTGVSWYEAAAYSDYAGKSLPTLYHWNRAAWTTAGFLDISPVIRLSNFGGPGPAPAGKYAGMNPYGTYDMAGNVKEWCWNAAGPGGSRRYLLGGAWNEPVYMFNDPDAQSPWSRLPTYGIRCVKYLSEVPPLLREPAETARRDYQHEKSVPDETFRIYRSFYAYDKTRLDPVIESTDDTPEHWKLQKVTFHAAYGNERVMAYLFLPRGVDPPYQTVVFFPPSTALRTRTFQPSAITVGLGACDFIVRSGRAVLYPVYKSTYERGDGLLSDRPSLTSAYRDHVIQWYKDFARSIDYLETRPDIDSRKIGYYGFSWGSVLGPILLALDDRCRVAVWGVGGFWQQKGPPEVEQINFAPRVKIPVLMLNGKYDFVFPVDTSQAPMFRLLGAPEQSKRHLVFESGHSVPRKELVTETLQWFDKHLGPVK